MTCERHFFYDSSCRSCRSIDYHERQSQRWQRQDDEAQRAREQREQAARERRWEEDARREEAARQRAEAAARRAAADEALAAAKRQAKEEQYQHNFAIWRETTRTGQMFEAWWRLGREIEAELDGRCAAWSRATDDARNAQLDHTPPPDHRQGAGVIALRIVGGLLAVGYALQLAQGLQGLLFFAPLGFHYGAAFWVPSVIVPAIGMAVGVTMLFIASRRRARQLKDVRARLDALHSHNQAVLEAWAIPVYQPYGWAQDPAAATFAALQVKALLGTRYYDVTQRQLIAVSRLSWPRAKDSVQLPYHHAELLVRFRERDAQFEAWLASQRM